MDIKKLQKNWDNFGKNDPMWAILTLPDKKKGKWEIEEFFETGKKEIALVMDYLQLFQKRNFKNVLDFGCGIGRLTQALCLYFSQIYGVDIAPSMIDLARQFNNYDETCEYFLNSQNNLHIFQDKSIDFIYTNITLQHMHPRYSKKYIKEFLRILAPDGILIFQIPNRKKTTKNFKEILKVKIKKIIPNKIQQWYHGGIMEMYAISEAEIRQILKKNNGIILDIKKDNSSGSQWESYRYCVTK